jgi:hypothetical protein
MRRGNFGNFPDLWSTPMIKSISFAAFAGLTTFTATAAASNAVDESGSILDIAKPIYTAIMGGSYTLAAALALVLVCALLKRYGAKYLPALHSDIGGVALTLTTSFGGAIATALTGGGVVSVALLVTSLKIALTAAGGYAMLKKLIVMPLLKPLAAKSPAWAQPIFAIVFWAFDKPDALADAQSAGNAAVAAKPGQGLATVVGEIDDAK